jgi:hypothetical protein
MHVASIASSVRVKLTSRDRQMMLLMMSALHHDSHEAERLELGQFFGITCRAP